MATDTEKTTEAAGMTPLDKAPDPELVDHGIMLQPVEPSVGRLYIGRVFAIVVLGGMGSIGGTVVAGGAVVDGAAVAMKRWVVQSLPASVTTTPTPM